MGKSIVRIIKKLGKRDRESRFSQRTRSRNQNLLSKRLALLARNCLWCALEQWPLICTEDWICQTSCAEACQYLLPASSKQLPLPGQESCLDIVFVMGIDWYVSTSRILSWHSAGYCTDDWCISLFLCSLHASSRSFCGILHAHHLSKFWDAKDEPCILLVEQGTNRRSQTQKRKEAKQCANERMQWAANKGRFTAVKSTWVCSQSQTMTGQISSC